jgi:hypothetical protein
LREIPVRGPVNLKVLEFALSEGAIGCHRIENFMAEMSPPFLREWEGGKALCEEMQEGMKAIEAMFVREKEREREREIERERVSVWERERERER